MNFLVAALLLGVSSSAGASPADLPFTPHRAETVEGTLLGFAPGASGYSVYLSDGSILHLNLVDQVLARDSFVEFDAHRSVFGPLQSLLPASTSQRVVMGQQGGFWDISEPRREVDLRTLCIRRPLASGDSLLQLQRTPHRQMYGRAIGHDAASGTWLLFDEGTVARVAADCRTDRVTRVDEPLTALHADPSAVGAYAIGDLSREVLRFGPDGLQWRRPLPSTPTSVSTPKLVALINGDLVVGYDEHPPSGPSRWRVLAFTANGIIRWQFEGPSSITTMGPLGDGFYIAANNGLTGYDPAGELRWHSIREDHLNISDGSIEHDPSNGLAWVMAPVFAEEVLNRVSLLSATGPLANWDLSQTNYRAVVLADSSLLVGVSSVFPTPQLQRLRAGSAPQTVDFPTVRRSLHWSHLADEHGSVSLTREGFEHWTLHVKDSSQAALWESEGNNGSTEEIQPLLAANDSTVCRLLVQSNLPLGASNSRLACHHRATGEPLWPELVFSANQPHMRVLEEGLVEIIHWEFSPDFVIRRTIVDSNGQFSDPVMPLFEPPFAIVIELFSVTWIEDERLLLRMGRLGGLDGHLEMLVLIDTGKNEVLLSEFQARPWEPGATHAFEPSQSVAVRPGEFAVLGWERGEPGVGRSLVRSYDYSGNLLWAHRSERESPESARLALVSAESGWLLVELGEGQLIVTGLNHINGTVAFTRESDYHDPLAPTHAAPTFLVRAQDRFALMTAVHGAVRGQWFGGADAALLATATTAANRALAAHVPTIRGHRQDASLRINGAADIPASGSQCCFPAPGVARLDLLSRRPDSTAPSSLLDGAWYDPELNGQGIFVETFPDSGQLYAGFFTYTDSPSQQMSELRWYSLQGPLPDQQGVADLTIYRNAGGRFLQGPVTDAVAIGTARLWLSVSGGMQVELEFDDATPDLGMDLVRVLAHSPNSGSRLWFEPELSGQGLLLANPVEPGSLVFGGWFTYDPEGHVDDPLAQMWLTIQANSAGSSEHPVTIYRTTGGQIGALASGGTDAIGEGVLRLISCDQLEFSYQFDQSDLAAHLAGRSGIRTLQPLGACGPRLEPTL